MKMYLPTILIWQWDFSTDQSKVTFWKSGGGVFTTCVSLRHSTRFTYSHPNTLLGKSERTYYLSYFINYIWHTYATKIDKKEIMNGSIGSSDIFPFASQMRDSWPINETTFHFAFLGSDITYSYHVRRIPYADYRVNQLMPVRSEREFAADSSHRVHQENRLFRKRYGIKIEFHQSGRLGKKTSIDFCFTEKMKIQPLLAWPVWQALTQRSVTFQEEEIFRLQEKHRSPHGHRALFYQYRKYPKHS